VSGTTTRSAGSAARQGQYGGEQEFYLASACDKVFLMPTASLDLSSIANYELFLRGMLDKIGAYPDALHIGDYKTASNLAWRRNAVGRYHGGLRRSFKCHKDRHPDRRQWRVTEIVRNTCPRSTAAVNDGRRLAFIRRELDIFVNTAEISAPAIAVDESSIG
jgi:Peptidase family S49